MSAAPLYLVRVGRHDCFDRLVFDVNGPAPVGFGVRYVPVVLADASGKPVPVAGGAALQVVVRAPALGLDSQGHMPGRVLATSGQYFYTARQLAGWRSLRAVRYAGSFEGLTTIAVGVRAALPFRVQMVHDRGYVHVIVDIAH
jgi:hypothetical protein